MAPESKPPAVTPSSLKDKDEGSIVDYAAAQSNEEHDNSSADLDYAATQNSILSKTIDPKPNHVYKAHWHIFVPTFAIFVIYIVGWVILYLLGKSGDSLARLIIVVLAVGVPILFAHAFLRYQTISIEIFDQYLRYQTGWPKADPVVISYDLIRKVNFTRGLSGRLFGGGTVNLQLEAGEVVGIADVEKTAEAKENIAHMIK